MVERTVTVTNPKGIHARPSSLIAKTASQFSSDAQLLKGNGRADAKSVMEILMLCVPRGTELTVRVSGLDEQQACDAIVGVINVLFEND